MSMRMRVRGRLFGASCSEWGEALEEIELEVEVQSWFQKIVPLKKSIDSCPCSQFQP
jgi:hypothetical protein